MLFMSGFQLPKKGGFHTIILNFGKSGWAMMMKLSTVFLGYLVNTKSDKKST